MSNSSGSLERWVDIPLRKNDTGSLMVLEAEKNIPFEIRRVYYLCDLAEGAHRGFHAHKELEQVAICMHGSCRFILDDGNERISVELDSPNKGLYIGNMVWREMLDFSPGSVLTVLASEHYDESDYIRDYDDFKNALKNR